MLSFCVSIYCPLIWSQWSQDPLDNVIITDTIIKTLNNDKVKTEEPDTVGLDLSSKELIISLQEMEDGRFLAFKREGLQTAELDLSNKYALAEVQQVLLSYLESRSGEEQIEPVSPQDIMEFFTANGFELTLVEGDHPGRINPEGDIWGHVIAGICVLVGGVLVVMGLGLIGASIAGGAVVIGVASSVGADAIVFLVGLVSLAGGAFAVKEGFTSKADAILHDRSIGKEAEEGIITALQTAIERWWDEGEPSFSEAFSFVVEDSF